MAKKRARKAVDATASALKALPAKVRKAIEGIRRPFASFIDDFRIVTESRAELAPKFMKAFGLWQAEVGGTFVEFCRVLVPDIGPSREDYRRHPAFQAADYLRRLASAESRAETTPTERAQRIANAPASPTVAFARMLKAVLPLIQQDQMATLFEAMRTQLHWPDRTVSRIQTETERIEPLVILREPRGMGAMGHIRLTMPSATPTAPEVEARAS